MKKKRSKSCKWKGKKDQRIENIREVKKMVEKKASEFGFSPMETGIKDNLETINKVVKESTIGPTAIDLKENTNSVSLMVRL